MLYDTPKNAHPRDTERTVRRTSRPSREARHVFGFSRGRARLHGRLLLSSRVAPAGETPGGGSVQAPPLKVLRKRLRNTRSALAAEDVPDGLR